MVGMCMKCGKPIPGVICTACPPDYKSTSRSPKKKKGFGKYIGKAKKINPFQVSSTSPTYGNTMAPPPPRKPLPPPSSAPQPMFDQQSLVRWNASFNLPNEPLVAEFWCKAVSGDEVLAGSTYVTPNYFGFTAPYNNQHVVVLIPFNTVLDIKPASPVISPSGQTVFEMTSSPGPSTTCIQIYTSDQLKHQFFDCKLVKNFATWFQLVTENWKQR